MATYQKMAIFFNGFLILTFGVAILQSGLNGMFSGIQKWVLGFGLVALCIISWYGLYKIREKKTRKDV